MHRDLDAIIAQMTLEEKAGLCSGLDFWHTKGVERLGIPSIMMTDGPHGLRKQQAEADHLGINESVPATCFPSGAGLACSWDRQLLEEVGQALGQECQAQGVSVLLGPAANIKRSPLCGRNFEYFSEDPYLSSQMAASHIRGVQSQGVGTSLKHYAANNQEDKRLVVDAEIDARTLREIYLASFEGAVVQAQPWTVMCAYNRVNGTYASQNPFLLEQVLRKEWGFEGFVVSDWGAVDEREQALASGLELEMPASFGRGERRVVEAVKCGALPEATLDRAVKRLLTIIFRAADARQEDVDLDMRTHHDLARRTAEECAVLLKNEDGLLPLEPATPVAVLGAFAEHPRYQGGGSSHIHPTCVEDALACLAQLSNHLTYAQGFDLDDTGDDQRNEQLLCAAVETAKAAKVAVIFAGLPDRYESEGYDRAHMQLPVWQNRLIEAVAQVQPHIVVVLSNGAPVEMPWIFRVQAVLETYLAGQASGGAVANLLYGKANPSGHLAETFPLRLEDNPSYLNFPGAGKTVSYREGVFVGYRYYDAKSMETLFPFGHGLSYTTFATTSLRLDREEMTDRDILTVQVGVKNTGDRAGKHTIQLYVKNAPASAVRPVKELRAFAKVDLQPGEEREVTLTLDARAFAYYHTDLQDWYVESGDYEILIGQSAEAVECAAPIRVKSTRPLPGRYHRNSTFRELQSTAAGRDLFQQVMDDYPEAKAMLKQPMFAAMLQDMPLRSLAMFLPDIDEAAIDDLLQVLNQPQ